MNRATAMRFRFLTLAVLIALISGCVANPLTPTAEAARVAQLAIGQTQAHVEKIMQRAGRKVTYPFNPDTATQIWRYEERFKSMCLFVTYDKDKKVVDVTTFEREPDERGKFGTRFSGSC
jgi:uncharacterized membrane protein